VTNSPTIALRRRSACSGIVVQSAPLPREAASVNFQSAQLSSSPEAGKTRPHAGIRPVQARARLKPSDADRRHPPLVWSRPSPDAREATALTIALLSPSSAAPHESSSYTGRPNGRCASCRGRSLSLSDHRTSDRGVIASGGERSCDQPTRATAFVRRLGKPARSLGRT
jgi:hypothetical protein